jgi:hypothetical protein
MRVATALELAAVGLLLACLTACGCGEGRGSRPGGPAADGPPAAADGPPARGPVDPLDAAAQPLDAGPGDAQLADGAGPPGAAGDAADAAPETATDASTGAPTITVENLTAGETVPHDLLVLNGSAPGTTEITLESGGRSARWPVVQGQFRALTLLAEGTSEITLRAGSSSLVLPIVYRPPTNPRFVRFLYIVAADGDGRFEGPPGEPTDQASALARLRLGARLMQTFTAETMRRAGFGRLTFRLARDAAHEPIVEIWKSKLTTAQARAMDGNALWSAFYEELAGLPQRAISLDVAVMSMTHYVPATKVTQAHTALGGGRLGLFGSGTLYAHAAAIDEIPARWGDARLVDTTLVRDDSAGRGTYWANYATGLGAMAHELGHCLSLPHPASHRGFMWRGFDHMNRTFLITEPRSRAGNGLAPVGVMDEAGLDRSNAVRLRFHRWLSPTDVDQGSSQAPTVTVDAGSLRISAPAGLRHVQYLVAGEATAHDEHLGPAGPAMVSIPLAALRTRLGGAASVDVSAMDDAGNLGGRERIPLPR